MPAITTTIETITPQKAQKYLAQSVVNRNIRRDWVARLTKLIENDQWHVTHQGIAFNGDGSLIDGHHRLLAIVRANRAVRCMVTRNLSSEANLATDQGIPRTVPDVSRYLDLPYRITNTWAATARWMMFGGIKIDEAKRKWHTQEDILDFIAQHHEAIAYAATHISNPRWSNSTILAVVARAWYHVNRDRLAEFCAQFQSGVINGPADSGVAQLRTIYLRDRDSWSSRPGRCTLYAKTECALRSYLKRRPITKLYEIESELYLLPGEDTPTVPKSEEA